MDIETLFAAKKILDCIESQTPDTIPAAGSQKKVVVRGDRSGVFFGNLESRIGAEVTMTDCRHIWYWSCAANVAELALTGVANPDKCKFVAPVPRLLVLDAIEIVDCTDLAAQSLAAVPIWVAK